MWYGLVGYGSKALRINWRRWGYTRNFVSGYFCLQHGVCLRSECESLCDLAASVWLPLWFREMEKFYVEFASNSWCIFDLVLSFCVCSWWGHNNRVKQFFYIICIVYFSLAVIKVNLSILGYHCSLLEIIGIKNE